MKKVNSENTQLEIMRHSSAHVMALAVKELWPNVKFAIGPAIENGFYYDFDINTKATKENETEQINESNLLKIEKKMKEIIKKDEKFIKKEVSIQEAKEIFKDQPYKLELIKQIADNTRHETHNTQQQNNKKINDLLRVTCYVLRDFTDLCKGPHIESTSQINPDAFKLTKLAGAYWLGDEKNKMLTRIYGVAFETKQELENYLKIMEEAEKRDHRKIGKEQELFLMDPVVGLGLALWQPKGAMLWRIMEDFWYKEHLKAGYELVRTPHIGSRKLWETSGHWNFYNESMYPSLEVGQNLEDVQKNKKLKIKEEYLLKPMNCPFHIALYKSKPRSYRELPIRWAECGTVYRYEKSGELSGLTRVRGFTQDDAHIICAKEQVEEEISRVLDFIIFIFKSFGFNDYQVYLSVRDSKNNKYIGSDNDWKLTEQVLEKVAKEKKLDVKKEVGGAVFYGPKLDFKIKDCLNREWQCATLQYDFNLPEKFDMLYINKDNKKQRPYMLHRALFGSFERFIGLLIEHYAGAFPAWLSPAQVKIISVGEKHIEYCKKLAQEFKQHEIRVEVDSHDETVGNKIRKAINEKIPYILVIGDREIESDLLAVRDRGKKETRSVEKREFIKEIVGKSFKL